MLQNGTQSDSVDMSHDWLDILLFDDCEPEERLDLITRDAAAIFKVPIALINLVTADRVVFKSSVGLRQGKSVPRCGSFCSAGVKQEKPYEVTDASVHPDYMNYDLVTGPLKIRSYVCKSLHAPDGTRIGTLSLFDTKPRKYTRVELKALVNLAEMADFELLEILGQRQATIS